MVIVGIHHHVETSELLTTGQTATTWYVHQPTTGRLVISEWDSTALSVDDPFADVSLILFRVGSDISPHN